MAKEGVSVLQIMKLLTMINTLIEDQLTAIIGLVVPAIGIAV